MKHQQTGWILNIYSSANYYNKFKIPTFSSKRFQENITSNRKRSSKYIMIPDCTWSTSAYRIQIVTRL